jgi:deoxyribodipyrimidine photo-lyase
MIQNERIQVLNSQAPRKGRYVLYWMQASQRAEANHALEYAVSKANERREPLLVCFFLTPAFPEANVRHYAFMIEGLRETREALRRRGIGMVIRSASPDAGAIALARKASLVVVDRGYLRIQREWRETVASRIECPLVQVESDAVVPVEVASAKEEYAAATIRPRIQRKLPFFLKPLRETEPVVPSLSLERNSFAIEDTEKALSALSVDRAAAPVAGFRGGAAEARRRLALFIDEKLDHYAEDRSDPSLDGVSHMSPYLHFGQISPLSIALEVARTGSIGREAYIEELIVRRELALNFVFYNREYDSFASLPTWARKALVAHQGDKRPALYSAEELELSQTHDPYWNAAQKEMVLTGKMHGYMRMYWGKKILEWTKTPEEAFRTALALNNRYELDGRDPNGFAGVAWCFGKHDRPWAERAVFGTIRYMNDRGLRRKFDIDRYVRRVAALDTGFPGD